VKPLHQNKNVPVFYHVPKNAGTFAMSLIFLYLRMLRRKISVGGIEKRFETNRNIVIKKGHLEIARILAFDPNNECSKCDLYVRGIKEDETHYIIELNDIEKLDLKKLNLFTIVIEADGFKLHKEILNKFQDYDCKKFILLREPIKRMMSFFNYITSESAKHEPTYGIIPNNLSEYVNSHYIEDSWLIRQFANINDNEGINDNHYDITYNELKHFDVADVKNTEILLRDVYSKYLNLELSINDRKVLSKDLVHNASKKNNHVLSNDEIEIVNERMKYEIKLYNNLVKC
jgi:hypothetical protein